jgi:hypothetical protein
VTKFRYKKIVLHVGLHKTGTSSIQRSCQKYRDTLRQWGVEYPVFRFAEREFFNHSDPLAAIFGTRMGRYGIRERLRIGADTSVAAGIFREQLQQELDNPVADTLLLSAELVCDFSVKDMLALRAYLQVHSEHLQVIAFVRSPLSSLESLLQQRCRSGRVVEADSLVGVVTARCEALQKAYPDALELFNYHEAQNHPIGLVGYFFRLLGLPEEDVSRLAMVRANSSVSMEAFLLMDAINRTYPAGPKHDHGVPRSYNDMSPLYTLPGQPFQLDDIERTALFESLAEEGARLERALNMTFPPPVRRQSTPLWQVQTLLALESAINRLDSGALREAASGKLLDESARLATEDPVAAAALDVIAQGIARNINPSRKPTIR